MDVLDVAEVTREVARSTFRIWVVALHERLAIPLDDIAGLMDSSWRIGVRETVDRELGYGEIAAVQSVYMQAHHAMTEMQTNAEVYAMPLRKEPRV